MNKQYVEGIQNKKAYLISVDIVDIVASPFLDKVRLIDFNGTSTRPGLFHGLKWGNRIYLYLHF